MHTNYDDIAWHGELSGKIEVELVQAKGAFGGDWFGENNQGIGR